MAKYLQFQIFKPPLTGDSWSGWAAREWVAKRLDGREDVDALLHYQNSQPITSYPAIRFLGGKDNFRIIGIGEKGMTTLMNAAAHFPTLDAHPLRIEMTGGAVDLTPCDGRVYTTTFVPTHKGKHIKRVRDAYQGLHLKEFKQWILDRLYHGINKQLDFLELSQDCVSIQITEIKTHRPAPIKLGNGRTLLVPRVEVTFFSDHDFTGQWSVGELISRGHGHIKRLHPMNNQKLKPLKIEAAR